ncbi:MAG: hypothetical protein H6624_17420 [Bdellovibrionaceae bacterium]|nr:hypothetical protein [Pseudobdellovibrionaceae bacterium]
MKGCTSRFLFALMAMVMIMAPMNSSYAKEDADKEKRRTSINFEDELIEGEVKKPELFYLLQKKQFNFKRLIKLRENFLPEMRRTAEDLPRGGSSD